MGAGFLGMISDGLPSFKEVGAMFIKIATQLGSLRRDGGPVLLTQTATDGTRVNLQQLRSA